MGSTASRRYAAITTDFTKLVKELVMIELIKPTWTAPSNVYAYTTTRHDGVSTGPYASLNLGLHVGDDKEHVLQNRESLKKYLSIPNEPVWLNQTHSTNVVIAENYTSNEPADASFTRQTGVVCAVLTADCLPILICNTHGTEVAAIHAGWRGLAAGVIENTLAQLKSDRSDLMAWLGPAIGPTAFEVGEEVRLAFIEHDSQAEAAFTPSPNKRWLANIYQLATLRLNSQGINHISGGLYCTYTQPEFFYSYRREPKSGRMASLIWFN